jgi:NAD(P)-dependent dehydrogenase (short-subunit alcohol dehydrogenase family)
MPASDSKVWFITGASKGFGRIWAEAALARGDRVAATARDSSTLDALVESYGDAVLPLRLDVDDKAADDAAIARAHEKFGRLDVVVNNAGVGFASPVAEIADKAIARQFDVNLRSVIEMYREAVPLLREAAAEHGNALVVNNASLTGLRPQPEISVYSALKSAVIAFTGAMNRELGAAGIKSTALCAGYVDTEMSEWIRERIPAAEMIRVSDIAGAMRWLLSTSPHCVVPEIQLSRRGDEL